MNSYDLPPIRDYGSTMTYGGAVVFNGKHYRPPCKECERLRAELTAAKEKLAERFSEVGK